MTAQLMTTSQIRDAAEQAGLTSAEALSKATGVSYGKCFRVLRNPDERSNEAVLERFSQYFLPRLTGKPSADQRDGGAPAQDSAPSGLADEQGSAA